MATQKSNNRKPIKSSRESDSDELVGFDEIREQALTVGGDIRELAETAGQAALDQMDPVERYIREKPLKSMLIAAGVGAVFGAFFTKR